jgi:hypothetical protein
MSKSKKDFKVAELKDEEMKKISLLESELGICLVAFEQENKIADLEKAHLDKIKNLEKELGFTIVAYKKAS